MATSSQALSLLRVIRIAGPGQTKRISAPHESIEIIRPRSLSRCRTGSGKRATCQVPFCRASGRALWNWSELKGMSVGIFLIFLATSSPARSLHSDRGLLDAFSEGMDSVNKRLVSPVRVSMAIHFCSFFDTVQRDLGAPHRVSGWGNGIVPLQIRPFASMDGPVAIHPDHFGCGRSSVVGTHLRWRGPGRRKPPSCEDGFLLKNESIVGLRMSRERSPDRTLESCPHLRRSYRRRRGGRCGRRVPCWPLPLRVVHGPSRSFPSE